MRKSRWLSCTWGEYLLSFPYYVPLLLPPALAIGRQSSFTVYRICIRAALLGDGRCHPLCVHARALALFADRLELYVAVDHGEESVVPPHAHVEARVDRGAPLAHDDRARAHRLPVRALHAQHLRLAVAPVPRRAYAFLMCHRFLLLL